MYRVVLDGVPVIETHHRDWAAEIAEASGAKVVSYTLPEKSAVSKLFGWVGAAVVMLVVLRSL